MGEATFVDHMNVGLLIENGLEEKLASRVVRQWRACCEEKAHSRATIEALVGALILARKRIEYYGASGHERHADHDAKEILPKIDSALQLARGSKGDE